MNMEDFNNVRPEQRGGLEVRKNCFGHFYPTQTLLTSQIAVFQNQVSLLLVTDFKMLTREYSRRASAIEVRMATV